MSFYPFVGTNCPNAGECDKAKVGICHHTIQIPISKAPKIGSTRKCPVKGCKGRVTRVVSDDIQISIKGATFTPGNGTKVMAKVGGQDVAMEFLDHKHTDPQFQQKMDQLSAMGGVNQNRNALSRAYRNKDGRLVVDVMSNIKDPLGAIEREKKQGDYQKVTKKINTPYKRRRK